MDKGEVEMSNTAKRGLMLAFLSLLGCGPSTTVREKLPPLDSVPALDLQRYLGTWYEIASYPQRFQKGCTNTTATYALKDNGEINVFNRCRKGGLDGPETSATGRARVIDPAVSTSRLQVSFFGPFWGDYWVIDLDPEYSFAVVGHPGRDYLWILSRTPQMEPAVYDGILERLTAMHYDVSRLQRTLQPEG